MTRLHSCPVCAYSRMEEPPEDGVICPCCGTEFGLDDDEDFGLTIAQIRDRWVAAGAPWFSRATQEPFLWNGLGQLAIAGLPFTQPPLASNSAFATVGIVGAIAGYLTLETAA